MTVLGIDHVQLAIPPGTEERARAFYVTVLGLVEVDKPAAMRVPGGAKRRPPYDDPSAGRPESPSSGSPTDSRGGMWLQAGPVQLHLGIEPDMRPSVKAHPALVVAGLDAYLARLAAAGAPWKEARDLPGVRRGHTEDPFGNRIELIERGVA